MNTKINVMISEEEINKRVCEIAEQISKDYEGKEVRLICILNKLLIICYFRFLIPNLLQYSLLLKYSL